MLDAARQILECVQGPQRYSGASAEGPPEHKHNHTVTVPSKTACHFSISHDTPRKYSYNHRYHASFFIVQLDDRVVGNPQDITKAFYLSSPRHDGASAVWREPGTLARRPYRPCYPISTKAPSGAFVWVHEAEGGSHKYTRYAYNGTCLG